LRGARQQDTQQQTQAGTGEILIKFTGQGIIKQVIKTLEQGPLVESKSLKIFRTPLDMALRNSVW